MGDSGGSILVAQGSPAADRALADVLRSAGFTVRDAVTAADTLRLSGEGADLIVLEDTLPDRPGVDLVRMLKNAPASTSVPILFVQGRKQMPARVDEEVDGFLGADAEPAELLAWVRSLLRRKDSLRMESLGRLASGIAHDFNNLLTVILGHADLVCEHVPADGPEQDMLDGLRRSAESAAQLAAQMLSLAREQPLAVRLVDLGTLVFEVVTPLRRVFGSHIEIVEQRAPNIALVRGVPCQLMQVILNLCLNARDAMPDGGRLTITTENAELDSGTHVRLRVADTGAGMTAEVVKRVFEPYFTTRPGQGTGLGLATVHRIVRGHQGWITCSSEVGRGSSFDLFFPAG